MNNKEFQAEIAKQMNISQKQSAILVKDYIDNFVQLLEEQNELPFFSLGTFEVKQKDQRVIVNPSTKKRMLVPPKLVLQFKPSNTLKNKYKSEQR